MEFCLTRYLVNKKHQFSKIWMAAHWERKIKRSQISEIDIVRSVKDIMSTEVILDLRISGHLLIGIVKIHSRKVEYLLKECNTIFYQVKIFRTEEIDLPDNKKTARVDDITLAEFFEDIGNIGNDILDTMLSPNQSHVEDITLQETYGRLTLLDENDMIDFGFQEEDDGFIFEDDFIKKYQEEMLMIENISPNLRNTVNAIEQTTEVMVKSKNQESDDLLIMNDITEIPETFTIFEKTEQIRCEQLDVITTQNNLINPDQTGDLEEPVIHFDHATTDELYLQPVKASSVRTSRNKKANKRKIIIDYDKTLSHDTIKKQRMDVSDITSAFDLAPASRRLMHLKNIGTAEQLLSLPGQNILSKRILHVYKRNLKTYKCDNFSSEEEEVLGSQSNSTPSLEQNDFVNNAENDLPCMDEEFIEEMKSTNMAFESTEKVDKNVMPKETESDSNSIQSNNTVELQACMNEEFIAKMESTNMAFENAEKVDKNIMPKETESDCNPIQSSNTVELQNTQMSKTSEEKLDYAFQKRTVRMLQHLKLLFEKKSIVSFSSVVKNKKKFQVAKMFLCLLMLKKYQIICLQQSESIGEIFISPEDKFDDACSQICQA